MTVNLSRRQFLKASAAVGGGLALEFSFPVASSAADAAAATEVNAWVVIHTDDRVVVRIARSEMGQGTYTALAQLVAEELECDWS
ncbi:MAG: molybdopterin cofactor-binding domain-containing protein, partial [Burkholderiales bacterium]